MENVEILGFIATIVLTLSWFPQLVKSIRTKSVKDFSYGYLGLLLFGFICWLLYGIFLNLLAVIVNNTINIVSNTILLILKIREDLKR